MTATRRAVLGTAAAFGALSAAGFGPARAQGERRPFSWEQLVAQAERAASEPWREPYRPMPEVTSVIDYQRWGEIAFRTDRSPFQDGYPVTFFHLGQYFQRSVRMHTVADGQAQEFAYDPGLFDMPADNPARRLPADSGFAGFRFQEWNGADDWAKQDWLAFLGASYLRAIGASGQYGLSARGIALDPALPDRPEEFPDFTEFWIEQTGDPDAPCTVYARLDGPSVTGAYRFRAVRGTDRSRGVIIEVDANLHLRRDVERLGLAPLTSMFWYGEYGRERPFDWRPEVHDSDGLLIHDALGAPSWRPLTNPPEVTVTSFPFEPGGGFGLMQRDRNYASYQDRAAFERRPNLWVEPEQGFERGTVELVELPTEAEYGDNIVAFFVPDEKAAAGSDFSFRYKLHWSGGEPASDLARLTAMRLGPRLEFDLFSVGPEPIDVTVTLRDGSEEVVSEKVVLRIWPEEATPA